MDPGVSIENFLKGFNQAGQLWCDINCPEKLLHDRFAWLCENQKLIIITVLMTTTQSKGSSFVLNREVDSPILDDQLSRHNTVLRQPNRKILGQSLAPKPGVDLFLLTFVRRKFQ